MLSTLEYVLEIPIKILNSGSPLSVFLETTDSGYIMSGVVQDARSIVYAGVRQVYTIKSGYRLKLYQMLALNRLIFLH